MPLAHTCEVTHMREHALGTHMCVHTHVYWGGEEEELQATGGIWPLLPKLTLEESWWPDVPRNSPAGVKGCFLHSSGEERLASRPLLADICQLVRTGYTVTHRLMSFQVVM